MRWNALEVLIRCDRDDDRDENECGVEVGESAPSFRFVFLFPFFFFSFFTLPWLTSGVLPCGRRRVAIQH